MAGDREQANEPQSKSDRAASVERMLNDEEAPVTEAPNEDVPSEPATGTSDVGESVTRRGEDIVSSDGKEPGRADVGPEGSPTGREAGTSTDRDVTGVDPQDPATDP